MELNKRIVTVDKGAIRFVSNGADIMAPGIVDADSEIKEGDLVIIVEEAHRKPLAIGKALMKGPQIVEADSGELQVDNPCRRSFGTWSSELLLNGWIYQKKPDGAEVGNS